MLDLRSDGRPRVARGAARPGPTCSSPRAARPRSRRSASPGRSSGERHPRLVHVAIVGHPSPRSGPGGPRPDLRRPPGARRAARDAADADGGPRRRRARRLDRARAAARPGQRRPERFAEVALEDGAAAMAIPWRYGLTTEDGPLGGSSPFYRLYEARRRLRRPRRAREPVSRAGNVRARRSTRSRSRRSRAPSGHVPPTSGSAGRPSSTSRSPPSAESMNRQHEPGGSRMPGCAVRTCLLPREGPRPGDRGLDEDPVRLRAGAARAADRPAALGVGRRHHGGGHVRQSRTDARSSC